MDVSIVKVVHTPRLPEIGEVFVGESSGQPCIRISDAQAKSMLAGEYDPDYIFCVRLTDAGVYWGRKDIRRTILKTINNGQIFKQKE